MSVRQRTETTSNSQLPTPKGCRQLPTPNFQLPKGADKFPNAKPSTPKVPAKLSAPRYGRHCGVVVACHGYERLGSQGQAIRFAAPFVQLRVPAHRTARFLHTRGPIGVELSAQVLKSGTSAGANYEEADDGSSPRDVLAKRKIVLRELKETSFRLRVLRQTGLLTRAQDPVIGECAELVKIVATLIRKSCAQAQRPPR
jgi:four helix bundle protein